MKIEGILPIGTVVLLKNSTRKLMIAGVAQQELNEEHTVWDYCGVIYPQGYAGAKELYMFNNDQIEEIFALGYQDTEQFAFREKVTSVMQQIRDKQTKK